MSQYTCGYCCWESDIQWSWKIEYNWMEYDYSYIEYQEEWCGSYDYEFNDFLDDDLQSILTKLIEE